MSAALFVVVLDGSEPKSLEDTSESFLIGKEGARWFDKHQLIVFKNGKAGAHTKHSTSLVCHIAAVVCCRCEL